jgi:AraC family transcriptional regulator
MISILRIAEGAYLGEQAEKGCDILRYIRDNIGKEITLPALCKQFNTNRTTLTDLMKELTGLSPMQYVLEERLSQSHPDLLFTSIPISEIAEKYGFDDPNYYIRAFKKRFGVTPLNYRSKGVEERIKNENIYHEKERKSNET